MESYNFVVNMDSDNISILKKDDGIVLSEPMVAVINSRLKKDNVVYVGDEAINYLGKLPKGYELVYPVKNGKIANFDICVGALEKFLSKVEENKFFKKRSIVFLVPCGIDEKNLKSFKNLGYALSCKSVKLVPRVVAASLVDQTKKDLASMQVYLAEDYVDVAVLYNNKIINGHSIDLGESIIKNKLKAYIDNYMGLSVEATILDKIQHEMATILPNDIIVSNYRGFDEDNELKIFSLNSLDLNGIYLNYVGEIADIIDTLIKTYSSQVIAELKAVGINLSGKMVDITGLDKFLSNRLDIDIKILDKPEYISLLGMANILHDCSLIDSLAIE